MPFHWEITWAVRVTVTGFFVFLNLFVEKWQQVERWPYWMLSQSLAWIRPSDTRVGCGYRRGTPLGLGRRNSPELVAARSGRISRRSAAAIRALSSIAMCITSLPPG